jgi:hypothetical protein
MKKDRSQERTPEHDVSSPTSDAPPEPASPPTASARPVAFDPSRFRLSQDFASLAGTVEKTTTVPVRKPQRQEWVWVHDGVDWCLRTFVLESKADRETFLVDPELWPALRDELTEKVIHAAITRSGEVLLWPLRVADAFGKIDPWNESAHEAVAIGRKQWIRVSADMARGRYRVLTSLVELAPPEWPSLTFDEMVELGFRDRVIADLDHPILKRLRGEV